MVLLLHPSTCTILEAGKVLNKYLLDGWMDTQNTEPWNALEGSCLHTAANSLPGCCYCSVSICLIAPCLI